MKLRIDYTKEGSEYVIDRLSSYVEKWRERKQKERVSVPRPEIRRRNTHRIEIDENGEIRKSDVKRVSALRAERRPEINVRQRGPQDRRVGDKRTNKRLGERIRVRKVLSRVGISFLTFIIALLITAVIADLIVLHGPSKAARDRFVLTVTETSAAKFLATWFLSDETVKSIVEGNAIIDSGETTDTTLIKLPGTDDPGDAQNPGDTTPSVDINSVQLIDIKGKTYQGKLLIVQNPKRVYIGTPEAYGDDREGVSTIDMVRNDNALYGINGGGFFDTGKGNGGVPTGRENSDGIVISGGKLMWGSRSSEYEVIGINKQGILVLGKMTAQQALDSGIVEALNFGPYLVMNGEACEVGGFTEAGLNPRTAIGQRADGAMLLLTIDGRQPSSMGATYEDLIEIMMNYGAVNAANLDGGSSTYMAQNSETENNPQIITQCASLYGPRKMATSILVSRADQINDQYE